MTKELIERIDRRLGALERGGSHTPDQWIELLSVVKTELQRLSGENEQAGKLREALNELISLHETSLELDQRAKYIRCAGDGEIKQLCEKFGYGAVMDSAARQWHLKETPLCPKGSGHTTGHNYYVIKNAVEKAQQALTAAKEAWPERMDGEVVEDKHDMLQERPVSHEELVEKAARAIFDNDEKYTSSGYDADDWNKCKHEYIDNAKAAISIINKTKEGYELYTRNDGKNSRCT